MSKQEYDVYVLRGAVARIVKVQDSKDIALGMRGYTWVGNCKTLAGLKRVLTRAGYCYSLGVKEATKYNGEREVNLV